MSFLMKCKEDCCEEQSSSSSSTSSRSSSSTSSQSTSSRSSSSSSEAYCGACDDGAGGVPDGVIDNSVTRLQVSFAGIVNGSSCNCASLNGTFILTGNGCAWTYTLPATVTCNNGVRDVVFNRILAEVFNGPGDLSQIRVRIVEVNWPIIMPPAQGGSYAIIWVKLYDGVSAVPCNRLAGEEIPPNSPAFGTAPTTLCRHDGTATCHVTSLPTP